MRIMTDWVHPDEPCHGYFTGPKRQPGYPEDDAERMIEQVFVIRGDAIACYEQDFGLANNFMYVPPLFMPSYGENPVGLMQWHGERHRNDPKWAKRMQEYKESSTLFQDVIRQQEERSQFIKNRSTFGPHQVTHRNSPHFSPRTQREWNNERKRRTGKAQF